MHSLELFRLYVSAQKSVNQSIMIEADLSKAAKNNTKQQFADIPLVAVFLAPVCFMIVWAVVVLIVSQVRKVVEVKNAIVTINNLKQHPCKNCQFFNDNNYLKCTVHPDTALTKEALNCSDYLSQ